MSYFNESKNVGLPYNFSLDEKGAFLLVGGPIKVQDNISFMLAFIGFTRTYFNDYVPDILWLVEKPITLVYAYKTLILSRLLKSFNKYNPYVLVLKIVANYDISERRTFGIAIQYEYNLEEKGQDTFTKIIQVNR